MRSANRSVQNRSPLPSNPHLCCLQDGCGAPVPPGVAGEPTATTPAGLPSPGDGGFIGGGSGGGSAGASAFYPQGAAAAGRRRAPKIYYATRTHSQIAQVVRELKRSDYRPRMAVLVGGWAAVAWVADTGCRLCPAPPPLLPPPPPPLPPRHLPPPHCPPRTPFPPPPRTAPPASPAGLQEALLRQRPGHSRAGQHRGVVRGAAQGQQGGWVGHPMAEGLL